MPAAVLPRLVGRGSRRGSTSARKIGYEPMNYRHAVTLRPARVHPPTLEPRRRADALTDATNLLGRGTAVRQRSLRSAEDRMSWRARWLPLHGAGGGAAVYCILLITSLLGQGTLSWAYPSDECATTQVAARGTRSYPDCPTSGRAEWVQLALNLPARAVSRLLPSKWVRPQEFRLPPHGVKRAKWSPTTWLAIGLLAYALGGALGGLVALIVRGAVAMLCRGRTDVAWRARGLILLMWLLLPPAAIIGLRVGVAPKPAIAGLDRWRELPKVRPLTRGPKFHFFGYYDKFQFDPSDRYVLGMAVEFDKRAVTPGDVAEVGMVDLERRSRWISLGSSRAWNWQQGCMLQWIPGSPSEIIWNDRESRGTRCASSRADPGRTDTRTSHAADADLHDRTGWSNRALYQLRAIVQRSRGYGYPGVPDPREGVQVPADDGIFTVDMATGDPQLILPLADIFAPGGPRAARPARSTTSRCCSSTLPGRGLCSMNAGIPDPCIVESSPRAPMVAKSTC